MYRAAFRAAMRRGSSIRMPLPSSHAARSNAKGTRVVLPAPGAASSIHRVPLPNVSSRSGSKGLNGQDFCGMIEHAPL